MVAQQIKVRQPPPAVYGVNTSWRPAAGRSLNKLLRRGAGGGLGRAAAGKRFISTGRISLPAKQAAVARARG